MGERIELCGGEELRGGYAAEVAPVRAVRSGDEGGEVVGKALGAGKKGAVGEGEVVLGEALVGGGGGGDEEGRAGAEAEEERGVVAEGGEAGEGAVEGEGEEVEMADDRKGGRGWWEMLRRRRRRRSFFKY